MMQKLAALCLGIGLAAGMAPPLWAQDTPATETEAVTPETVVATVNGTEITIGHLALARAALDDRFKQYPPEVLYNGLREQLIQQTVLVQALQNLPRRLEFLLENERRAMIAAESVGQAADAAVTDEAVHEVYDRDFANAPVAKEFNASHILLADEAAAQAALVRAKAGEDFAELARELSTGPSGPNGGELGWFEKERMVAPFADAVAAMEVGTVAGPVQTEFGFHIIRLNKVRDAAVPPLEEVRPTIERDLQQAAAEAKVKELVDSADIVKVDGIDPQVIMDGSIFID